MGSIRVLVCGLGILVACGGKKDADKPGDGSGSGGGGGDGKATPTAVAPVAAGVAFGDCAGPTVAFVSGAKPMPFTADEGADTWTATADQDDPPPPPEEDKPDDGADESGGTGTAMALDEGKMGKKDSDRAEGQYKMKKVEDDAQLARQQAIDQARAAGILGSREPVDYQGVIGNETGEPTRDMVNRNGYGAGGFGQPITGWGTIGHGAGTGNGGAPNYHPGAVPSVSVGQPAANGDLDKAIIRRYIKRNITKIQYCYEKQLLAKPSLEGTVMVQFFIAPSGSVTSSAGSGLDPEVATCVAAVIKDIEFPKPNGGGGVVVNYPFSFRKAGSGGTKAAPAQPPVPPPAPPPEAPVKFAESSVTALMERDASAWRSPFRDAAHGPVDPTTYKPGEANPLRAEQAAITACVKGASRPYGAVVVALAYDATTGAVTTAEASGLADTDGAVRACIATAAKRVKRPANGPDAQRCPLAFGTLSDADRTTIAVTAKSVALGTKDLGPPPADHLRIPALVTALADLTSAEQKQPVVSLLPPFALHPDNDAPVGAVLAAITSIVYVDGDFTLARKAANGTWQTLAPTGTAAAAQPTVPVPFGTAGRFMPLLQHARGPRTGKPVLSLFIERDKRVTLGVAPAAEFAEIVPAADQAKQLATALADRKKSADFRDRKDIEIAADPSLTYADLLGAIDLAVAAGFTDWRITYSSALDARP